MTVTILTFGRRRLRLDLGESHLRSGIGSHELRTAVQVQAPWLDTSTPAPEACLTLAAHVEVGPTYTAHALTTASETYRLYAYPSHEYLRITLTDEQLVGIDEARSGGSVELTFNVVATLFDVDAVTRDEQIIHRIAPERWLELLHQAGAGVTVTVRVPSPLTDPVLVGPQPTLTAPSAAQAATRLRQARRQLLDGDFEGCVRACRPVLENLRLLTPAIAIDLDSRKKSDRTQEQRWAALFGDLISLTHAANHDDAMTANFTWSRADAQAVLALTAGLLARATV